MSVSSSGEVLDKLTEELARFYLLMVFCVLRALIQNKCDDNKRQHTDIPYYIDKKAEQQRQISSCVSLDFVVCFTWFYCCCCIHVWISHSDRKLLYTFGTCVWRCYCGYCYMHFYIAKVLYSIWSKGWRRRLEEIVQWITTSLSHIILFSIILTSYNFCVFFAVYSFCFLSLFNSTDFFFTLIYIHKRFSIVYSALLLCYTYICFVVAFVRCRVCIYIIQ